MKKSKKPPRINNSINTRIKYKTNEKNQIAFQKLTPTDSAKDSIYSRAIDYAFDNSDVNNVAISGPLGSGKTSVLATYEKNHPEKNFIKISLASFQNKEISRAPSEIPVVYDPKLAVDSQGIRMENENEESLSDKESETLLEGKIINHLIHQIPKKNIPQTFFSTKEDIKRKDVFLISVIITTWALAILHLVFGTQWNSFTGTVFNLDFLNKILPLTSKPEAYFLSGLVVVILSFVITNFVVRAQKTKHILKKLNVKGNEIEVFEDKEDSHFDKHLNEMLYLLRHTKADAIVFEDLDRFDNSYIYVQLRELNVLLNSKIKLELKNRKFAKIQDSIDSYLMKKFPQLYTSRKKNQIKFFYLLRDDIFSPKDRTKFFDFIIPVIPIVSFSNSFNIFLRIFNNSKSFKNKIELEFLRKISLYIDDMRIIKNICNEFFIYYETLEEINPDYNKMLAMIIYKNLFPKDFVKLLSDSGFVADFFNKGTIDLDIEQSYDKYKEVNNFSYFQLLKYLIDAGYIDKTYPDYISYFYSNDITRNDKLFVRSVSDRSPLSPTHLLDSPEKVLDNLNADDFGKKEALNYQLFDYLLSTDESKVVGIVPKRNALIKQIKDTKNYDFINLCFDYIMKANSLKVIMEQWPSLFSELYNNNFSKDILLNFSKKILLILDENLIMQINYDGCLKKFVSEKYGFIEDDEVNINKFVTSFKLLDVKLKKIDKSSSASYLKQVYEGSLYEINMYNIKLILSIFFNVRTVGRKCYSYIFSEQVTPLNNYITKNLSEFLKIYLETCNGRIDDDEKAALSILNSATISEELKIEYINCLTTRIFKICDIICKDIWTSIFNLENIMPNEDNILHYFVHVNKIDRNLIGYINNFASNKVIDFSNFRDLSAVPYDQKTKSRFYKEVIVNESLDDERYVQILSTLGYKSKEFNYLGISENKMQKLIDKELIDFNSKTIQFIREEYPDCINWFIEKNILEYTKLIRSENAPNSEINYVLSSTINDDEKIEIINSTKSPISIKELDISERVKIAILRSKFDINDLKELCLTYKNENIEVKNLILDQIKSDLDKTAEFVRDGAKELKDELFSDADLSINEKIKLFEHIIEKSEKKEACDFLEKMNLNDVAKILIPRKRPRVKVTKENKKILDAFKRVKWIVSYQIEGDNEGPYYKVTRK